MSLGILVETSLAKKGSRSAVVNSLIDMLRHMSDQDEAFILTYDNNLVFAQDLTNDPQQLEEALEGIKPQRGAVLDDAIAFAAGHLARIAKYPNRQLLVISDGTQHRQPRVSCADLGRDQCRRACGFTALEWTSARATGARACRPCRRVRAGSRASSATPGQFRRATKEMAQNMGIDFRF